MPSGRDPSLALVLEQALRHHTDGLRVAMPGRVEKFDAATQTADVLPMTRLTDIVNGVDTPVALPVVPSVPVVFAGGGAYAATFPVARGDECLVVFCDLSLDEWFASGGIETPVDLRVHGLNGAVALVGLRAQPHALSEFDATRAVFGAHGPRVACDGTAVHVGVGHGVSGTQSAMRGEVHLAALDTWMTTVSTALKANPYTAAAGVAMDAATAVFRAAQHTTPAVKLP